MRKLVLFLLCFMFSALVSAQDWHTDVNKAQQQSKLHQKPILMLFEGSDWCANCIAMHNTIWDTATFRKYAKDNLVLLSVDFPSRRSNQLSSTQQQHNDLLAEKYNSEGIFPRVVFLDSDLEKITVLDSYMGINVDRFISQTKQMVTPLEN